MNTLECPECERALEKLYVGALQAEIAMHCPGCDAKYLVCEVCGQDFLIPLLDTRQVPYLEVVK